MTVIRGSERDSSTGQSSFAIKGGFHGIANLKRP
jgi:hypothetical protein